MIKFRRVTLPDGKVKLEKIPDTLEEIENKKKSVEEKRKINKERRSNWLKNQGFNSEYEYRVSLAKKSGYSNFHNKIEEHLKEKGYKSYAEYQKIKGYESGRHLPMEINEDCAAYLGIYLVERKIAKTLLPIIFGGIEKEMPVKNKGFDFIVTKNVEVDVKSSCLQLDKRRGTEYLSFDIRKNKIAKYFLMVAINDRTKLDVLHIWLMKNNESVIRRGNIRKTLNEFNNFTIVNNKKSINRYKEYELPEEMLKIAREICNNFKEMVKI